MLNEACLNAISSPAVLEAVITVVFGCVAAWFSWLAYCHSKEKFRLELLNKRWPIYQTINDSAFMVHNKPLVTVPLNNEDVKIYETCHMARLECLKECLELLRAINMHEMQALFGKEVRDSFIRIIESIAGCTIHESSYRTESAITFQNEQMQTLLEEIKNLPSIFAPYMDFSTYKKP